MGKKIDLNAPRTSSSGPKQRRTNHSFSHPLPSHINNQNPNPNELEDQNNEQQTNNNPSATRKKGTEIGLRAAGVPKGMAKAIAKDNRTYELDDKIKATIKFPIAMKFALPIILFLIPVILLMLFVTLFQDDGVSINGGNFALGQDCPTITVTDTDCDMYARNCKHTYDGEVDFENYIAGVVAAEVGFGGSIELYKAQAIAARSFVLSNVGSDCTVKGNASFQAYEDIEDSYYKDKVLEAIEATKGLVMVRNDDLLDSRYASACVVNADDNYYYIRYGSMVLDAPNFQKVPKEWNSSGTSFDGLLSTWYSYVDQNNTDYANKDCPNNHDYGMSQVGALYLINEEDYNYEDVLKYYYGEFEIMSVYNITAGADGFINPTDTIYCSSPYGMRLHPVYFEWRMHTGIDIGVYSNIYAAKSGTVVYLVDGQKNSDNSGYGNVIKIEHDDGDATLYAHIAPNTIPSSVYYGARVEQGDVIGYTGTTGTSTGVHLHYEVFKNGNRVDPADYLDLTNATGGACKK